MYDSNDLQLDCRIGKKRNIEVYFDEVAQDKDNNIFRDLTKFSDESCSIIGREKEIEWMCHRLLCRFKPNILLIGDPGVGKTVLVEGLAKFAKQSQNERINSLNFIEVSAGSLIAGTSYRGDFERKVINLIRRLESDKSYVIFIYDFLNNKISNVEEAINAIQDVEIAIVAADIPRGKIWQIFSEASFATNTPILFLGSAQTWICCGPLIVPGITPCYDCSAPEKVSDEHPVVQFLRDRYTTTLIDPYNSIGASLGVLEAVKYITNFQECKVVGKRLLIDLGTYETFLVSGKINNGCSICGSKN